MSISEKVSTHTPVTFFSGPTSCLVSPEEFADYERESSIIVKSLAELEKFFHSKNGGFTNARLHSEIDYETLITSSQIVGRGGCSRISLVISSLFKEAQAAKITTPQKYRSVETARDVTEVEIKNMQLIECLREKYLKKYTENIQEIFNKVNIFPGMLSSLVIDYLQAPSFPFPKVSLIVKVYEKQILNPGTSDMEPKDVLKRAVRFMEYIKEGDLFEAAAKKSFSFNEISKTFKHLLLALDLIHKNKRLHGDIKPENCTSEKLLDLGLMREVPEGGIKNAQGSIAYLAPEILLGIPYDASVDIWALGVMGFVLTARCQPFDYSKVLSSSNNIARYLRSIQKVTGLDISVLYSMCCEGAQRKFFRFSNSERRVKLITPNYDDILIKGLVDRFGFQFDEDRGVLSYKGKKVTGKEFSSLRNKYTESFLSGSPISYCFKPLEKSLMVFGKKNKEPLEKTKIFLDFLQKCLKVDPRKRLSAAELWEHPFITQSDPSFEVETDSLKSSRRLFGEAKGR